MRFKRFRDWSVKARANCGLGIAGGSAISGLTIGIVYSEPIKWFFASCCGGDITMTIAFWACIAVFLLLSVPFGIWWHFHKKGKRKKRLEEQQTRVADLQEELITKQLVMLDSAKQNVKDLKEGKPICQN